MKLVMLMVVLSGQFGAQAATYTFTTLDYPGASHTFANGINSAGEIVGVFLDSARQFHGWKLSGGVYTEIAIPGSVARGAEGINNAGQISGGYSASDGRLYGYLLTGSTATTITFPGADSTSGRGLNNNGQVAGTYLSGGINHGFVFSNGSFSSVDVPGSPNTYGYGINDSGAVVGFIANCSGCGSRGFLLSGGNYTILDAPGTPANGGTIPLGLNNAGHIVGLYVPADDPNTNHGFLLVNGVYTTIDHPNANFGMGGSQAVGINDAGQIVGVYIDSNDVRHGFLATPPQQQDTAPPVISGLPAAGCALWPPDGRMVQVATITASDAQSGIAPGTFQVTASSSEPPGPNAPDVRVTPDGSGGFTVELRAERLGQGSGRVYTILASASDLAGNVVSASRTCSVPHDEGQ